MKRFTIIMMLLVAVFATSVLPASAANTTATLNKNSAQPVTLKTEKPLNIKISLAKNSPLVLEKNDVVKIAIQPGESNAEREAREQKDSQSRAIAAAKAREAAQAAQAAKMSMPFNGDYASLINAAAAKYGVSASLIASIIRCESGFNPNAKNRHSTASGLGQFLAGTWRGTPLGQAGYSVFDPAANIEMIAWMLSVQGTRPWNASRSCWAR